MKHIIVPLADSLGEKYNYLAAVPVAEKHFFGMVLPSEDPQPALIQEGGEDSCWMYSVCMSDHNAPEAFRAVFEALRSNIDPYGGDSFTVDVVVDAAHAALAEKTLAAIRKAGQWYLVHIIFLSERNSPYGEQQSSFFTKIHNDSSGRFEDSGLGWTWFTMLSDENRNGATGESIRKQREELLPFILCEDHHNEKPHSCFTYAVNYQLIQEQRIPEIPRIQTIRFACRALQAHEVGGSTKALLGAAVDQYRFHSSSSSSDGSSMKCTSERRCP